MRKLFWSGFAGGVAIAAGVFSTAHFAVRHPDSAVGGFLYGASHAVAVMNPFSGFAPALARLEHAARSAPGGEEPAEVEEAILASVPNAEPPQVGVIVIPEDEPVPAAPIPVLPDTLCPVHYPEAFQAVAPAVMPRCEEEGETFERIGIDFNDPEQVRNLQTERLHMPKAVGEGEEQEADHCPAGCADKLLRLFQKMIKHAPECREDANRHEHHQGCPPTGLPHGGCPGMSPCQPLPPAPAKAGKPHGLFKTQMYEFCPAQEKVDTMEFRATDRQLYDYGFGPL
jgi:hypothetical protein